MPPVSLQLPLEKTISITAGWLQRSSHRLLCCALLLQPLQLRLLRTRHESLVSVACSQDSKRLPEATWRRFIP